MSRSIFAKSMKLQGTVYALVFLLAAVSGRAGDAKPARVPNLLLITLDTTRADHLGSYGYRSGSTPTLDSLAAGGVLFSEAHAHVPLTLPSHANMLTGKLPSTLNLRVNGLRMKGGVPTLATLLKSRGYSTAAAVSSVIIDRNRGLTEGFDVYDDQMTLGPRGGGPPEERRAEDTTKAALSAVKRGKAPYFLWVHYYDPHADYRAPEPYGRKFEKSPYDGEIAYMDAQVGALLGELEKSGLMENTLIVVAGDHGEGLMEFGERQHGVFLYEPTMHVPLFFIWKGHLSQGRRVQGLCALSDVAPTVCDLLGLPKTGMDGTSLAPVLLGTGTMVQRHVYIESYHGYFTYGWAPLRGMMTEKYKFIQAPKAELYKWAKSEKDNLASSMPGEAQKLAAALKIYPEADKGEREQMERLLRDPSNAENLRQLMSLGYLSGQGQDPGKKGLLDPKDAISIEDEVKKAQELLDAGKMQEGTEKLLSVIKRNPTNVPALSMLGSAYLATRDYDKARVCFEEELKLKPQLETAHLNLGTVYRRQGKVDLAIKEYRAALVVNPRFPEAAANLAQIYLEQKRIPEAMAILEEALKSGAESSDMYFEYGIAYASQSKFEKARWAFTKSVSLDPRRHEAVANLGKIAYAEGKIDEAIVNYERALRIDGRNSSYMATLGSIYLSGKNDQEKSLGYYQRALAADPYGREAARLKEIISGLKAAQKQ